MIIFVFMFNFFLFGMTLKINTCWQLIFPFLALAFPWNLCLYCHIYYCVFDKRRSDLIPWKEKKKNLSWSVGSTGSYKHLSKAVVRWKVAIGPCFRVSKKQVESAVHLNEDNHITHHFRSVQRKRGRMWLKGNQYIALHATTILQTVKPEFATTSIDK